MPAVVLGGLIALGAPGAVPAFGPAGHRIVGHVADQHLCQSTRNALKPLLAGKTLADAGTWPDQIRRQPEWQHSKPWHYLNVGDRGSVAAAARRSPDNVLAALARFEGELGNSSLNDHQRGQALRFVAHFVADIHQPLHIGRGSDLGGNRIPVRIGNRTTNLHAVWDADVLQITGLLAPGEWVSRRAGPDAAEVLRLQRATPLRWAEESHALRSRVYAFEWAGDEPLILSADYLEGARVLADERLQAAGVRLAGRLNGVFGAATDCVGKVASRTATL